MKNREEEFIEKIEQFNRIIASSESIVFLGGAGVSTESGIPDFRSKNGLYHKTEKRFSKYRPEYLLSIDCLKREPEVFFDYYRRNLDARKIQPNRAHEVLAEMEQAGKLAGIITQNIDGLHQKAGSRNVQEIHGTTLINRCVLCRREYDQNFIFDQSDTVSDVLQCKAVDGVYFRYDTSYYRRPHHGAFSSPDKVDSYMEEIKCMTSKV